MAEQARVLGFDNLSYLSAHVHGGLCRRANGDGSEVRGLYTDRDQAVFAGSNPVLLTSIADAITRPDLLSRALLVQIDSPGRRAPKSILQRRFVEMYPHV